MEINRAVGFIEGHGSSLEKARLHSLLYGTSPEPDVVWGLTRLQNADGGFPFGMVGGNLSTINDTTVALWWLEELGMPASAQAEKAFGYLVATQSADGSWDEDPRIVQYDLPPWIQLGDLKSRLYLTAYAAYWLAGGKYSHLPALKKALQFLRAYQDTTGRFPGYLHTTWIATSAFLLAGKRYAGIAARGIEALSGMAVSGWEDSQIAWAVDCLSAGGLQKDHPLIESCLAELVNRQSVDGSWASEDGEAFAVGATLQALKVLKRYNLTPFATHGQVRKLRRSV